MRDKIPDPILVVGKIKTIVVKAISESSYHSWSSFRAVDGKLDKLRHLRKYFGRYFQQLIPLASALQGESVFEGTKLLNDFFCKTALNHILDADYASYVIKNFIFEINLIMEHKGAPIQRFQLAKKWVVKVWSEIDVTEGEYKSFRIADLKAILNTDISV
jgi:hypothetical protein